MQEANNFGIEDLVARCSDELKQVINARQAKENALASLPIVFFDLETTGLPRTSEIIQIGAVYKSPSGASYVSSRVLKRHRIHSTIHVHDAY